jgi:hypothetical protein
MSVVSHQDAIVSNEGTNLSTPVKSPKRQAAWAVAYIILLIPPLLFAICWFTGLLQKIAMANYSLGGDHFVFVGCVFDASLPASVLLIVGRFLPQNPLPKLKKFGFVVAIVTGASWLMLPTV